MTVKKLLDELQKVDNKNIPVAVAMTTYAQGSEWTGMYENGSKPVEIVKIISLVGDKLAGVNDLDEVDHIEIVIDENDF